MLKTIKNKQDKRQLYYLAVKYLYRNVDSAEYFLNRAIRIALRQNNQQALNRYYMLLGKINIRKGELEKATRNYISALEYAQQLKNDTLIIKTYNELGRVYHFRQMYDSAIFYYNKALRMAQNARIIRLLPMLYGNIGLSQQKKRHYVQALKNFKKAADFAIKVRDTIAAAKWLFSIGNVYYKIDKLDSAEFYLLKSLNLYKKVDYHRGEANIYVKLGNIALLQKRYAEAARYLTEALKFWEKCKYSTTLPLLYSNLASSYIGLNNIDSSTFYLNKLKEYDTYVSLQAIYKFQYYRMLKHEPAIDTAPMNFLDIQDSLFTIELFEKILSLRQLQQARQQLRIQKLENEKQRIKILALTAISLLSLIILAILYIMLRQKRKDNILLKHQQQQLIRTTEELKQALENIKRQKQQIEEKNQLISQINMLMTASLRSASHIQKAMLPPEEYCRKFFEYFVIFKPRDIVSGDFYWISSPIQHQGKTYLFAAVADCVGHGVPGALISILGMKLLDKFINQEKTLSPAKVLNKMDKEIKTSLRQNWLETPNSLDIALIRLNWDNQQINVNFCGAKLDLFYFSGKSKYIQELKGSRQSVGDAKRPFEEIQLFLPIDTIFYLTTDGFIDQTNPMHRRYGKLRFIKLLNQIAQLPLQQQKQILLKEFDNWRGDVVQRDDVTIVGFKLKVSSE